MEPTSIRFGGGLADTVLHPLVAIAMLLAIILIVALPRRYVIVPLLLAFFTITKGQVIVVAGVHFPVFRILILVGLARWMRFGGSALVGGFNLIDRLFTLFAVSYMAVFSLQWMQTQAFIKCCGDFVDVLGGYLLLRFLIRDRQDILRTIKVLAIVATINAICMLNEQRTGNNVFALLGGMPMQSAVRDGKVRSQGAFEIFITAGAFGATLPPLFVWLWSTKSRMIAALGLVGATVMAYTCRASTTYLAEAAGILGLCFWPLRKKMRFVRWALVFIVVALHLVMHGPVWSLLEKIDLTGSSSSYHRYMLVDNCIRHFSEWWLLGCRSYGSWGWEMWDLSDQYVAYCLTGGLLTFILFIAFISRGFAALGTARKRFEAKGGGEVWLLWCLGAALFSHTVAFIGIGYFDQVQFSWYALLAMISAATAIKVRFAPTPATSKVAEDSAVFFPETVTSDGWSI
jgi:hypothetical protein